MAKPFLPLSFPYLSLHPLSEPDSFFRNNLATENTEATEFLKLKKAWILRPSGGAIPCLEEITFLFSVFMPLGSL
jgi:hypothetical protein